MAIPLTDVAWQHRQVRADIDLAIDRILTDVHADGAKLIAALEATMALRLGDGCPRHRRAVGACRGVPPPQGLGIGPGDEVITVPNSDIATTAAISHTGARFVLVDVDADTHNLDPNLIEAAIAPHAGHRAGAHVACPRRWTRSTLAVGMGCTSSRTPRWRSGRCTAERRWDRRRCRLFLLRAAQGAGRDWTRRSGGDPRCGSR